MEPRDKLDRLRHLLDYWQEIFDPVIGSSQPNGSSRPAAGSKPPHSLPKMSQHRSVRELERALTTLADREPVLARHLKAYRCNAEWRTADKWVVRKLPSGRRDIVEQRVQEKLVPEWVELRKVTLAEMCLLRLLPGPIEIPQELWEAPPKT